MSMLRGVFVMQWFFLGVIVGCVLTLLGVHYLGSLNKKPSSKDSNVKKTMRDVELPNNDINLLKNKFPKE
jgi:hypothetical protein